MAWMVFRLFRLDFSTFLTRLKFSSRYFLFIFFLLTSFYWSILRYLYCSLKSSAWMVSSEVRVMSVEGVSLPLMMLSILHLSRPKLILMSLLKFDTISRRFLSWLVLLFWWVLLKSFHQKWWRSSWTCVDFPVGEFVIVTFSISSVMIFAKL